MNLENFRRVPYAIDCDCAAVALATEKVQKRKVRKVSEENKKIIFHWR